MCRVSASSVDERNRLGPPVFSRQKLLRSTKYRSGLATVRPSISHTHNISRDAPHRLLTASIRCTAYVVRQATVRISRASPYADPRRVAIYKPSEACRNCDHVGARKAPSYAAQQHSDLYDRLSQPIFLSFFSKLLVVEVIKSCVVLDSEAAIDR